jgi:pimeloyl-ACP methyl ester carboxylesterase
MPDLPPGRVNYRVAGPPDSTLPPVIFVHGILARRLADGFPRARLVEAGGGRTFLPPDEPDGAA